MIRLLVGTFWVLAAACGAPASRAELLEASVREAEAFEEEVRARHVLLSDPSLEAWLAGILQRLFPERGLSEAVFVLREPLGNAFVLSNGHIYVTTGLLALLRDEAELAAVLAHEGVHHELEHLLASAKAARADRFRVLTGNARIGAAYSRDQERAADAIGLERLLRAGYPGCAMTNALTRLEDLALAQGDAGEASSTHPALRERVATLARRFPAQARPVDAAYQSRTQAARESAYSAAVRLQLGAQLRLWLSDRDLQAATPMEAYAMAQGELLGQGGDVAEAERSLRQAVALRADFADAHLALARLLVKQEQLDQARGHFQDYLRLRPLAEDARFVRRELEDASRAQHP